jgi:cyclopropane-fatty-acyl-phospholipid synthase
MHMRPVSSTTGFLEGAGFEIRALREHYVWTVRAWAQTLEDR